MLKKGDVVNHAEHGLCTVLKVGKNGCVWVEMLSDGVKGTVSIYALRRA